MASELEDLLDDELGPEEYERKLREDPLPIVKGDLAKAYAPSVGRQESIEDELDHELQKSQKGYSPAKSLVVQDHKAVEESLTRPKDLLDDLDNELTPVQVKAYKTKSLPSWMIRLLDVGGKKMEKEGASLSEKAQSYIPGPASLAPGTKLVSDAERPTLDQQLEGYPTAQYAVKKAGGAVKNVLTVLSADEHAIVKGISKLMDVPPKDDFSEYTYTTLLKDLKAPDNALTDSLGLTMSIFLSPSTYLTAGTSSEFKVGSKALSARGVKLANAIIKERVEAKAAEHLAKTGKELAQESLNKFAQTERDKVMQEIGSHFGLVEQAKGEIIGSDVAKLPKSAIDPGGLKLSTEGILGKVPGIGNRNLHLAGFDMGDVQVFGKTVLKGEDVAKVLEDSGLASVIDKISKLPPVQMGKDAYQTTKKTLGKAFIPNYGISKEVVRKWEDTETASRNVARRINDMTEKWFTGMSKGQREEFASAAIDASEIGRKTGQKIDVKAPSGDPIVQDKLDRWYAQGKYSHRVSMPKKFEKYATLFESDQEFKELANWFPGVDSKLPARPSMKIKINPETGMADREFLQARSAEPEIYTRDPVKAISYKATQYAYANLHDKFYQGMVKNTRVRKFASPAEAAAQGYLPLRRPFLKALVGGEDLAKRAAEPVFYAKKEFVEQYEQLIRQAETPKVLQPLSYATNLFKQHVTSMFPAFHARNFNSNIVMNAYHIGGHAVEPVKFKMAMDMVRGKNLDRVFQTEIGEKMTLKSLIQEAQDAGVIKSGAYMADLGGETLGGEAQTVWQYILGKANPLSLEFAPSAFGKKIGEKIEGQARLVNYLTWRQKGLSPKLAAAEVDNALFNYGALTDFEQKYAKLIIPFYTFTRKNLENHIKVLAHRPGTLAAQMKFFRDLGPNDDEWDELPDWAKNKFVAAFNGAFTTGYGLPMEDIVELSDLEGREMILRTNPLIRFGLEKLVNKDFFSDRNLESINSAKEFKFALEMAEHPTLPQWVKAPFQQVVSFLRLERDKTKPNKIIGDPDKLHILRSSFTSRWQSMVGQLQAEDKAGYEAALRFALGIAKLEPDLKLQTSIKQRQGVDKILKIGQQTNLARKGSGAFFVGGSESAREMGNEFIRMVQEGVHPKQIEAYVKAFEERATQMQEQRTEP